ncbi:MAG: hypothetical protein ACRDRW_02185 [Pseudonocardiaceae bacterium]
MVEVADVWWLAHRDWSEQRSPWTGGVLGAVEWVIGTGCGPITGRDERPVTWSLAVAELTAAAVVMRGSGPLESECARLGVAYREPLFTDRDHAVGVWRTLGWLCEPDRVGGSPLPVPQRRPDGSVPSADELYAGAIAVNPGAYREPGQRVELRGRAVKAEADFRWLVARIEETQRRAGVV